MSAVEMERDPKSRRTSTRTSVVKPILFVSEPQRVGGGYSVQFFAPKADDSVAPINCVWSPCLPTATDLRRKVDMQRYDYALAQFMQAVADDFFDESGEAS